MSMYTHATTRERILRNQDAFRSHTQIHAEEFYAAILRMVVQELFIAAAATVVAFAYMQVAIRLGTVWLVEA